jgi:hypothetical protein
MRLGIVTSLVLCAVLSGCGGDDDARGVLDKDDLPSVSKVLTRTNLPARSVCSQVKDAAEFSISIDNKPSVMRDYVLDNGDHVDSSLLGPSSAYGDPAAALDRVKDAITACADEQSADDEKFTPIADLPSGAVGYTSTTTTSAGPRFGERVFATQGDNIVVVGTRHDGKGDPKVDVVKLLPKALERAKDAPRE